MGNLKKLLFLLLPLITVQAQDGWLWQNPWPQGDCLNDVFVIDKNKMIAVGNNSVILTTNDGGDSWQIDYYDELNTELTSIFFIDEYTGWICGTCNTDYQFGIVLKTDDGGAIWERVDILPNANLQEIQFVDKNIGWASGINKISGTPYLFKTKNGGETWIEDELSPKQTANCTFQFFDPDTGIVTFQESFYGNIGGEFIKTHDGGITWDSLAQGFNCIFFNGSQNGWAVRIQMCGWGGYWHSFYTTNDGGKAWQIDTTYCKSGTDTTYCKSGYVNNIYFSDTLLTTSTGAFGFYDNGNGFKVGEYGCSINKSEDGGRTWNDISKIETTEDLNSVFFLDENKGWAVGGSVTYWWGSEPQVYQQGHVLNTNDGGDSWKNMDYHTDIINYQLRKVFFVDRNTGFSLGYNEYLGGGSGPETSALFKTSNAGISRSWHKILAKESTRFTDFHFIDKNTGLVVGEDNTLLRTTDGGNTWTSKFPASLDSTSSNWTFNTLFFLNEQEAWISAAIEQEDQKMNYLLKTNDGGVTWDSLSFFYKYIITDMHFINPDTGWFCGKRNEDYGLRGFIAKTENGGKHWQYEEYYSVRPSLSYEFCALSSIEFFNKYSGWALGENTYYTEDGGKSWYMAKENQLSRGCNDLFFINENTGWIVGNGGKILKTTTGGITDINEEMVYKAILPNSAQLFQNYPNPFNPTTAISYKLPAFSQVELNIYNILGQKVAALVNAKQNAGMHTVQWNAAGFASGMYFIHLESGKFVKVRKCLLIR